LERQLQSIHHNTCLALEQQLLPAIESGNARRPHHNRGGMEGQAHRVLVQQFFDVSHLSLSATIWLFGVGSPN
jgi:hypothetical protein